MKADVNLDGVVNAVDIQLVINAVLQKADPHIDADVNRDGMVNAADIQIAINEALSR
ncbi:MAG: dockerin type I domain-containing protein [Candidatus Hydrogenedentes bacterium]|nr:dockerin type I domain-containing protein [Candidatus Hydrogenedentota bacterium]